MITIKPKTYINEEFSWNSYFYDLFSVVAFNVGEIEEAIKNAKKALELNPSEKRLKENIKIMSEVKNKPEK